MYLLYYQWACGGGALPLANSSLNVPAAFSWDSRLDWSTLIACGGHTHSHTSLHIFSIARSTIPHVMKTFLGFC